MTLMMTEERLAETPDTSTSMMTTAAPSAPNSPKRVIVPRQGRTTLKKEMVKKEWPLAAIAQGSRILLELNRFRFLTNQQVADLLFVGKRNSKGQVYSLAGAKDAADRSVMRLFETELLEKKQVWMMSNHYSQPLKAGEVRPASKMLRAHVNILTREGAKIVARLIEEQGLDDAVRWTSRLQAITDQNIAHELEVTDAAIALRRAILDTDGLSVLLWRDDQQLRAMARNGETLMTAFTPDGLCLVESVTGVGTVLVPIFLEIDRQTETIRRSDGGTQSWKGKMARYNQYLAATIGRDPLWGHLGLTAEDVATLGTARVLTIAPTPGRAEKLRQATLEVQGRGAYLFSDKDAVYDHPGAILEAVWKNLLSEEPVSLGTKLRA